MLKTINQFTEFYFPKIVSCGINSKMACLKQLISLQYVLKFIIEIIIYWQFQRGEFYFPKIVSCGINSKMACLKQLISLKLKILQYIWYLSIFTRRLLFIKDTSITFLIINHNIYHRLARRKRLFLHADSVTHEHF